MKRLLYSENDICIVAECNVRPHARWMCKIHYLRWSQLGDALAPPRQKKREVHGMTHHPLYRTWQIMIDRCINPHTPAYVHYGSRGISVCERWRSSFVSFLEDMGERPAGTTLDRIDVNGNYEPGNCRWATQTEQMHNTRTSKRNTSGRKGVHANKNGYYEVHIGTKYVGNFKSFNDAVAARERAEKEFGYSYAV